MRVSIGGSYRVRGGDVKMMVPMRSFILALLLLPVLSCAALCDGSKLAYGDVIGVAVDGEREYSKPYQLNRDGCISMSQIGQVKLIGLNTSDAASEVAEALREVLVNPQVTVTFMERAKMNVFVVGQVKRAGLVEVGAGDRVLQALAQAAYDDTADLSRVEIRRGTETIALDLQKYLKGEDMAVNIELESGDTVVVPRSDVVGSALVLGQASKVGAVPLSRGMTFREAMGLIGGVTVEADTEKITIKREGLAEPIRIDYQRAMEGDPAANVELQPLDVVFVPEIETSFFTVMGGVNRPGQYPLKGKLTLTEAIGLAGGATPHVGDLRKVQVIRGPGSASVSGEVERIDLTKVIREGVEDPMVKRGDVVYVTEHRPRMTVLQVIQALAPIGWLLR